MPTDRNAAAEVGYDVLMDRVQALLEEWGRYQQQEPGPAPTLGYPRRTPEAAMAEMHGRRSATDLRQRWAQRRGRRKVQVGERTVAELPMCPDRQDRQSKVRKVNGEPQWPDHVQRLDRIMGRMPNRLMWTMRVYWAWGMSIRQGAAFLKLSESEFRKRLEGGTHWTAGQLQALDIDLCAQ